KYSKYKHSQRDAQPASHSQYQLQHKIYSTSRRHVQFSSSAASSVRSRRPDAGCSPRSQTSCYGRSRRWPPLRCAHRLRPDATYSAIAIPIAYVNQFTPIMSATPLISQMRLRQGLGDGEETNRGALRRDRKLGGRGVAYQRLAHL